MKDVIFTRQTIDVMKKTVQIVTIPLNKEGWSKGDLLFTGKSYKISPVNRYNNHDWKSQQLLVLSDDEVQKGDYFLEKDIVEQGFDKAIISQSGGCIPRCWIKKIIASYPHIEGTLPISKETVQAWIDSGTPGEGSVDKHEWSTVLNDSITIKHLVKNNWKLVKSELPKPPFDDALMYYYERNTLDPQGNLLLEFGKKIIDTLPYPELVKEISEYYKDTTIVDKPSIPTDEEIEVKATREVDSIFAGSIESPVRKRLETVYISGYKQALKDLGYE